MAVKRQDPGSDIGGASAPSGGARGGGGSGSGAPPPPPPPPTPQSKNLSTGAAYNAFINAHPTMRPYSGEIWKWAGVYGIDKVVAATLFWRESFSAAGAKQDPATIESPTGQGVGIGQINPNHVGGAAPWGTLHQTDLVNPSKNIQWSMWFFAQQVSKFGDPDTAYSQGYNPGYTGSALTSLLPKGYVPKSGLSPTEQGGVSAETSNATAAAKTVLNDRWAVLGADGKIKFVKINDPAAPPKNVLKYGPTPLTQSSFIQTWRQAYQDTFFAYTGRQASGKEIAGILKNAPSTYTLSNSLAGKTAWFQNSPTYKAHAPGIIAVAKQVYGQDWKADKGLVAKAIAQNWDQATLEANLRARPEYLNGPAFKDTVAKMSNVYQSIYGKGGTPQAAQLVSEVSKQGWTQDQFAAFLRQQPEYGNSEEAKTRSLAFAQQIGLLFGQQPTLTADQALLGGPPGLPKPAPVVQNVPPGQQPIIRGEPKNEPPFTRRAY